MLIARVVGELVSTQKHPSHEGRKLLLVQPLNLDGTDRGDAVIALDAVDAGVGDRVLVVTEGRSHRSIWRSWALLIRSSSFRMSVPDEPRRRPTTSRTHNASPAPHFRYSAPK